MCYCNENYRKVNKIENHPIIDSGILIAHLRKDRIAVRRGESPRGRPAHLDALSRWEGTGLIFIITYKSNDLSAEETLEIIRSKGGRGEKFRFDVTDSKETVE